MSYPFNLKGVYNFDVYPSAILGTDWQRVTVMAVFDYETALAQGVDIPALHAQVYSYLPSGTPDDPSQYDYVKLRTASGSTVILGIAWIKLDSVAEVDSVSLVVTIDNVSSSDVDRVRAALSQNNFTAKSIKVVTSTSVG